MIVDSSALVAAVRGEPDGQFLGSLINAADSVSLSAATLLETSIVVSPASHQALDDLIRNWSVRVVAFDAEQARVARNAYARYGKGSGSPARLNFGDCMAYALAKVSGEPLLFKGDDFNHTDITPAQ